MRVTPLDIRRKEFKRSMRGYSDEEVDIFLDEVADEFERLFQENMELQDRMQRLEEQIAGHVQMKDALEKTLVTAQLQADEMRVNARKEGELILRDAELKARQIVNDSYSETQRVQQALIQLKHLEEDFRFKFRSLLEGHLKLLNEAPITAQSGEGGMLESGPASGEEVPLVVPSPQPEATAAEEGSPVPGVDHDVELSEEGGSVGGPVQEVEIETGPGPEAEPELGSGSGIEAPPVTAMAEYGEDVTREATSLPDDDLPTEETELIEAEERVSDPVVSEAEPPTHDDEGTGEEEAVSGFFFGRRLDDGDDAFLAPETVKKDKGRDFEW